MSDETEKCNRCGRSDGLHEKQDGDCVLSHRKHSRALLAGTDVCEPCIERWGETLTEIVNLYADLSSVIPLGSIVDDTADHTRTKRDGSPAMFRLVAYALRRNEINPTVFDEHGKPRHTWLSDLPPIPDVLANWAEAIWDANGWGGAWPTTVTGAAAAIRADHAVIAAMPDVDTFDAELRWIHRALRNAHGISEPEPLFDCLSVECSGHVWQQTAGSPRCDRCGRRYDRLDIVRARGAGLQQRRRLRSAKTGTGHA